MPNLLVIDNDPAVFHAFRRFFRDSEVPYKYMPPTDAENEGSGPGSEEV